jgi:hypothetical protein
MVPRSIQNLQQVDFDVAKDKAVERY